MADIPTTPLEILTQIGSDDLLSALGLDGIWFGRNALKLLCRRPARRFARQVVAYDEIVGAEGLQAGHAWVLDQFVKDVEVRGREYIPSSGPLLVAANHPGISFGKPIRMAALERDGAGAISTAVHAEIRRLIEACGA